MHTRIHFLSVLIAISAAVLPAQDKPGIQTGFGVLTGDKVRLRAGPADFHAEVARFNTGDVVQIVGQTDEWVEVRVPGGFPCFVSKGTAKRAYVKQDQPGEGLVVVEDLQLRPKPTKDFPPMGKLRSNQRVVVLNEEGDWLRLLSPDEETLFIYQRFVKRGNDQASLEDAFKLKSVQERDRMLKEGALSRQAMERWSQLKKWETQLDTANRDLDQVGKDADPGKFEGLAERYRSIAESAPKGSAVNSRAQERLSYVKGRQDEAEKLAAYTKRIKELRIKMEQNEEKYVKELKRFTKKQKDKVANPKKKEALEFGTGQLRPHLISGIEGPPIYTLVKGGKRHYFVISKRYDLSEYMRKTIRILEWEPVSNGPISDSKITTVRVLRLEVVR